ncbi:MAG: hypothetical protein L0G69_07210 [Brevibacterium sp.]|nr:hypothetical protein [Brevibacterium sp.]
MACLIVSAIVFAVGVATSLSPSKVVENTRQVDARRRCSMRTHWSVGIELRGIWL